MWPTWVQSAEFLFFFLTDQSNMFSLNKTLFSYLKYFCLFVLFLLFIYIIVIEEQWSTT